LLATIQIVSKAEVFIEGNSFSSIKNGILIFVCIEQNDNSNALTEMVNRIINFRMLEGPKGAISRSLKESSEEVLIVSQFTLAAITDSGNKPSFHKAAKPSEAKLLYDEFVTTFSKLFSRVKTGKFGAYMDISITNKGPVTFNFKT
jgi:D-tyrosyl-tRNA(Tyr) deacylase|tara:strand:+ start:127 stop:564 length:438 start_codon:yes stop_codon:yes gene_type:complete